MTDGTAGSSIGGVEYCAKQCLHLAGHTLADDFFQAELEGVTANGAV